MIKVKSNETYASITSLVLASISLLSCASIVFSIRFHPKSRESYHLRIVSGLLTSDMLLSACVILYYIIQYPLNSDQLTSFCHFYLPMVVYCFLTSYAWTIMFALRFRIMKRSNVQSNRGKLRSWTPPIRFRYIWIYPLLYLLPLFVLTFVLDNATRVFTNKTDTDQSCTFDHDHRNGVILDLVYFQIPLLLTIIINIVTYFKGLYALRNSPHSVIARQMNKAGGYLGILLLVWVPNIIYNLTSIFNGAEYETFLNFCVILSSSQVRLVLCFWCFDFKFVASIFFRVF